MAGGPLLQLWENIFGIDGLHDIGTVFFLIAIISLSMKKFMNKNNEKEAP